MKAVIYARFSSEKQNEASIEGQLRECMQYAAFNNIQVVGNYIDRAQSAKTDHRPEFQHMIKDSYKNLSILFSYGSWIALPVIVTTAHTIKTY